MTVRTSLDKQAACCGAATDECILTHPELQGLRRWVLCTRDAHEVYRRCGWSAPAKPEIYMERANTGSGC